MPIHQSDDARDREWELAGPCRDARKLPHAFAAVAPQLASLACGRMHGSWTVPGFDTRTLGRGLLETSHERMMPK